MEKIEFAIEKVKNIFLCTIRKIIGHRNFKRKKYYGKKILGIDDTNKLLYEKIKSGDPFLVARFGDAELRTLVYCYENNFNFRKGFPKYIKKAMHLNAGFFPVTDENLLIFGKILKEAASKVDVYGVWFNLMEDYIIHKNSPQAILAELEALEPYRSDFPWSYALKGKKVLVVHPFSASIEKQYKNKEELFENKKVLPDFELITYKTVQTNAGGECDYSNWFEALNGMFEEIKKINFDIAIVGCGSYGLPLAAKIRKLDKQVIHLAGATQILFGIRGARWDVRPEMQKYFNSYWVRPIESERPKNAKEVEGGCYW